MNFRRLTFICCLLLFGSPLRAAVGDITGLELETNGWVWKSWISGFPSNSMFFNGLATNNALTATNGLEFTATSMGFMDSGAATTYNRKWYGTKLLRLPFPSQTTNDITTNSGTGSVFRGASSDWVFDLDSNITASARAAAFVDTNASVQCVAASGITVTNSSTQPYPKVIGGWTWPDRIWETNQTMRLRWVGFHGLSPNFGQPLACVKFIVTDENSNKVTNTVSKMTVDWDLWTDQLVWGVARGLPFGEYIADFSLTTFTNLDQLRCDVIAYPWIGDSAAVLDTTLDTYPGINQALPTSITNLCDRLRAYTDLIAVVSLAGDDTNGRVTNTAPANVNSAHYFKTGRAAFIQLASSNNTMFGHNDVGGTVVYYRTGVTNWSDGSGAGVGNTPKARIHLTAYPGDSVTFTNDTGTDDITDRIKFSNVTLAPIGAAVPWNNIELLWFDRCRFDSTATTPLQASSSTTTSIVWLTHCDVTNLTQGLRAAAGHNMAFKVRGCNLDGFGNELAPALSVGNIHPGTNRPTYRVSLDFTGMNLGKGEYSVHYNNYYGGFQIGGGSDAVNFTGKNTIQHGVAFVQNVCEFATNSAATPLGFFGSSDGLHSTNFIVDKVLFIGKRFGWGYNDSGSTVEYRWLWSVKNLLHPAPFGTKHDTFGTGNGNRVGGWPVLYGVGFNGNDIGEEDIGDAEGSFDSKFVGMNTYRTPLATGDPINDAKFTDRKANAGAAGGTLGGGNHRLLSESAVFRRVLTVWTLPFDLDGLPRGAIDPAGPYASGNVKKGAFF